MGVVIVVAKMKKKSVHEVDCKYSSINTVRNILSRPLLSNIALDAEYYIKVSSTERKP